MIKTNIYFKFLSPLKDSLYPSNHANCACEMKFHYENQLQQKIQTCNNNHSKKDGLFHAYFVQAKYQVGIP